MDRLIDGQSTDFIDAEERQQLGAERLSQTRRLAA